MKVYIIDDVNYGINPKGFKTVDEVRAYMINYVSKILTHYHNDSYSKEDVINRVSEMLQTISDVDRPYIDDYLYSIIVEVED